MVTAQEPFPGRWRIELEYRPTREMTEVLWLPLVSPSQASGLQPSKDTFKNKSAFSRDWLQPPGDGWIVKMRPILLAALVPAAEPAGAGRAPRVVSQRDDGSVSPKPAPPYCSVLLQESASPLFKQGIHFQVAYPNPTLPDSRTRCWSRGGIDRRSRRKQKNTGLLGVLITASTFALCPVPRGNGT